MHIAKPFLHGIVLAGLILSAPLHADSIARGKSLYETKCHACHDRSVHNRSARKAKTYGGIRKEVTRWDGALGGGWGKEDIDDVTRYLNETYYKFRCPETVCREQSTMSKFRSGAS